MKKRLFAWVLVLALVMSLMPAISVGAAETEDPNKHSHEGWTAWTDTAKLPTAAGKYYLTEDVVLTEVWSVSESIELCLNGHTVKQTGSGAGVAILNEGKNSTLSVYDCVGTGTVTGGSAGNGAAFNIGRTTTLNWYGGTITGNTNTGNGCVYLQKATAAGSGGAFYMYGGSISGNKVKNGTIYGAGGDAGYVGSRIGIYGGTVSDNQATGSGGAIFVTGRGKVHIENTKITGNKAGTAGSAIYAEGSDHPITLKNVEITGNIGTHTSATGYSAAVYTCGGGTHLTLSGKVVISGNTNGVAGLPDVVLQSSLSDVLYVDALAAGSNVTFKTNKVTATAATKIIALAEGGSQADLWHSGWITYMDATGATKSLTYGASGFYFVEGHYHGDRKYAPWTETAKLPQADADGVGYYLADNVTLISAGDGYKSYVKNGNTLHLCMNGKTVASGGETTAAPFNVAEGSLYLQDCTAEYDEDGYLTGGGRISGFTTSAGIGSAIYILNANAVVEISGVTFADNVNEQTNASYGGGAIQVRKNTAVPVKVTGCRFTGNSSAGGGGAILLRDDGKLTAKNCIFTENTAEQGGALYVTNGTLVLEGCRIENNLGKSASAISVLGSTARVTVRDTVITGNKNTSKTGYGAVNNGHSTAVVILAGDTVIWDNLNKDGQQQNLHAPESTGVMYDLTGLGSDAKVGVTLQAERTVSYFSTAGMTAVPVGVVSDSAEHQVVLDSGGRLAVEPVVVVPPEPDHVHKLCGDAACTEHGDTVFQKWEKTDSLPTSGCWYLADNVTLTAVAEASDDLTICLNGKTITQTAQDRVLQVASGKVLSITDCGTEGVITGGRSDYGSAVRVNEGATFSLYAGKLTGNGPATTGSAAAGAAVFLRSYSKGGATFNMYGGEICGNGGEKCWGGAVTNASGNAANTVYVNIYGGKIYDNTVSTGGAIRMANASVTTVYGGQIYGNRATSYGGAIYLTNSAQLKLEGGQITDNTAAILGGGVYVDGNAGAVTVSGLVRITDNTVDSKQENLYLSGNALLTMGQLAQDAEIGVTAKTIKRAITEKTDDYSANFRADKPKMLVTYKDGAVWLEKEENSDHYHCVCCGVKNDVCDHTSQMWIQWGDDAEETTSLPTESGYYYLTGDVNLTEGQSVAAEQTVYLCLNGRTVTQTGTNQRHLKISSGSTYTVTDCCETAGGLTGGNRTYGGSFNVNVGATFNLFAGKLYGNTAPESEGGAIYMQESSQNPAVFNMYGGEIRGNTAKLGGAIRAAGSGSENVEKCQVNIYGGTIKDNRSTYQGGAIYAGNRTVVNLYGGEISGNTAEAEGGAIRMAGQAVLNLKGTALKDNVSASYGGAVFASNTGTKVYLDAGVLSGNQAKAGGAVMLQGASEMVMNGGTITANSDTGAGGAGIYVSTGTFFTMNGGQITGNKSAQRGGGIYLLRSEGTFNGGEITNNESVKTGGGLNISGATVVLNKLTIKGNTSNDGGGLYINRTSSGSGETLKYYPSTVTINDGALITANKVNSNCGGMLLSAKDVVVTMNGGEISKNQSTNGAGVMTWSGSAFIMKGGKITGHKVTGSGGGMYVSSGSAFIMEGGSITGNSAKTAGGVYFLRSEATLSGGSISGNTALQATKTTNGKTTTSGGNGGGIYVSGAKVKLCGTTVSGNTAQGNGGGVAAGYSTVKKDGVSTKVGAELTMTGGTVSGNTAKNGAGILTQTYTQFYLRGGTVCGNQATASGAGLYISTKSILQMSGGQVVRNQAASTGGGIYALKSTVTITGGALNGNRAGKNSSNLMVSGSTALVTVKNIKVYDGETMNGGSVVVQSSGTLHMENCQLFDNSATKGAGGAVYVGDRCLATFTGCSFFDNTATGNGGAIRIGSRSELAFTDCSFENNTAEHGGALWAYECTLMTMENCQFRENAAQGKGGAIFLRASIDMTDCVLESNTAGEGGGAIYTYFNTATVVGMQPGLVMKNCQVKNNTTEGVGGGLWVHKSVKTKLYDSQVTGNTAALEGGGIWASEDLELHGTAVTGNTSGGSGYAVYFDAGQYDGHSYITSRNKISGNVVIADNTGCDLWLGEDITLVIGAEGLGEKANIRVTLDSGVVTNRIFGAYHYEGGDQNYTITYGDRSMTEPEYDDSLTPEQETAAKTTQENAGGSDLWLYIGIGVLALAIIAVGVLLTVKKKKAGKAIQNADKE